MRGKTIHINHSSVSSYLIFSLVLVMGIVSEQWEVITITTLGLVVHSLLDLVEIRDKPTPSTEEKFEYKSFKISKRERSFDYKSKYDELIH